MENVPEEFFPDVLAQSISKDRGCLCPRRSFFVLPWIVALGRSLQGTGQGAGMET